jgi:hypothetical protein
VSINPTLDSKKRWLVPMLLLLFVSVIAYVLSSKIAVDDNLPTSPISANGDNKIEGIQPGIYQGPNMPDEPILRVPTHGSIRGRITSEQWAMWPSEVVVELLLKRNNSVVATFAGRREENKFAFENLKFDNYRLRLVGERILPFGIDASINADQPNIIQNLALRNAASITGYVYDTAGNPASNVQVVSRFQHPLAGFYVAPQIAMTNKDGHFSIEGVRPGQHNVFVGAEHSPLSKVEIINISENAPQAFTQFTINQFGTASVFINVVKPPSSLDKEYKKMRVSAERLNSEPKFILSVGVNENGVAQFNALPPGRFAFTVYGGGYNRTHYTATVITSKNSDIKIDISKR